MNDDIFIQCMKISKDCTNDIMRSRPTSKKLTEKLQDLYKKFSNSHENHHHHQKHEPTGPDSMGPSSSIQGQVGSVIGGSLPPTSLPPTSLPPSNLPLSPWPVQPSDTPSVQHPLSDIKSKTVEQIQ